MGHSFVSKEKCDYLNVLHLRGLLFGLSEGESRAALSLSGRAIALHSGKISHRIVNQSSLLPSLISSYPEDRKVR